MKKVYGDEVVGIKVLACKVACYDNFCKGVITEAGKALIKELEFEEVSCYWLVIGYVF